jgi:molybdopterin molybdotransferase
VASIAAAARKLAYEDARARVMAAAPGLAARLGVERVALDAALGRFLAEPIVAGEPLPRFDNSAVDGYAVRAADVAGASDATPVRLAVLEAVGAGHVPSRAVGTGEAALVMTGAPLPRGADCVVMRERTAEDSREVRVLASVRAGENVRPRGEDADQGETIAVRGRVVGPGEIAALATLGRADVSVARRPRVAVLSTGDELKDPGEALAPGQIYDSNSHTIAAAIVTAGCVAGEVWRVRDDVRVVADALAALLETHDVVLSLGGVSMGDFDPVKLAIGELAGVEWWRVGMRPGGPQAFGSPGDGRVFYGLPGNPVSSSVVFDRLARPMLRAAMGAEVVDRPTTRATLADHVHSALGRRDFIRVQLEGGLARLTGSQSSGAVTSLAKADGLGVIPEDVTEAPAGTEIEVILWR